MLKASFLILIVSFVAVSCASRQKEKDLAELNFNYGTQYLMSQDYTQALTYLSKAHELAPNNHDYSVNLAMAYYFKGEKDLAKQQIQDILRADPKNTDARSNLASFYFEEGDIGTAEKIYKECLTDLTYAKQARVYYNLALIELRKKNEKSALAYLSRSVKEDDTYCPAWLQMGLIDMQAKNLTKAQEDFKNAGMGTCVNNPVPMYWQAVVLMEKGEYLNARLKFDEMMGRFPQSEQAGMAKEKLSQLTLLERRLRDTGLDQPARESKTPTF